MHTGSCLCGGVRFRIDEELQPIQICHCSQCRKAQGTPFATNTPVASDKFTLHGGADLLTEFESSPGKKRVFCSRCGSPVYSYRTAQPGMLRIRAGLIDEPLQARPVAHIYAASRCNWWSMDDALPQYPGAAPHR